VFGWLRRRERSGTGDAARHAEGDPLFDASFQAKLEMLALAARRLHRGQSRAERRSKKTGSGVEFADHREYSAGDDFRYLDWIVYGRSGRLLLRLFEEEEDLSVYVLLDCSRSMAFGAPPKFDYARRLAAALAFIALAGLDRVALVSFDETLRGRLAPTRGRGRIFAVLDFLRAQEADGPTGLGDAMRAFAAQNKRRGVAILISDLYDPRGFEEGLNVLRYQKFETHVIQVFDPGEVRPPLHGDVRLVDEETGEARDVTVTPRVLERYAQAHADYRASIERFCAEKQVAWHAVETSTPFDEAILRILRRGGMLG
jgi:uncharacterized protein (DUF58 family)